MRFSMSFGEVCALLLIKGARKFTLRQLYMLLGVFNGYVSKLKEDYYFPSPSKIQSYLRPLAIINMYVPRNVKTYVANK